MTLEDREDIGRRRCSGTGAAAGPGSTQAAGPTGLGEASTAKADQIRTRVYNCKRRGSFANQWPRPFPSSRRHWRTPDPEPGCDKGTRARAPVNGETKDHTWTTCAVSPPATSRQVWPPGRGVNRRRGGHAQQGQGLATVKRRATSVNWPVAGQCTCTVPRRMQHHKHTHTHNQVNSCLSARNRGKTLSPQTGRVPRFTPKKPTAEPNHAPGKILPVKKNSKTTFPGIQDPLS